jgi:hypothetical protein
MAPDARAEMLRVRMSPREREMLMELAEAEQLTASEYIRLLIRRAHEARPQAPPKKKRSK